MAALTCHWKIEAVKRKFVFLLRSSFKVRFYIPPQALRLPLTSSSLTKIYDHHHRRKGGLQQTPLLQPTSAGA